MSPVASLGQSRTTDATDEDAPKPRPAEPAPASQAAAPHASAQDPVAKAVADYQAHPDASTQQQVYSAVHGELAAQMHPVGVCLPKQTPGDQQARINAYGNKILRSSSKDPSAQSVLKGAIAQYQASNLASLDGHGLSAQQALTSLNTAVKGLPAKTAASVLKSEAGQKIFQNALKSVTQPLKGLDPQSGDPNAADRAQAGLTQAWNNLASLTAGIPPSQAQELVKESLPAIEKLTSQMPTQKLTAQMFNDSTSVVAAISDVPAGSDAAHEASALTSQIAKGYTHAFETSGSFGQLGPAALVSSMGNGADPTLAVAITKTLPPGPRQQAETFMDFGVQNFQKKVKGDIAAYSGDYQQLTWLINNAGKGMTQAQINQAVKTYTENPKWSKQTSKDYQQMVKDGTALLQQLKVMGNSGDPQLKGQVSKILGDSQTQYALDAAIKSNPSVTSGPGWESTLKFLSSQAPTVSAVTGLVQDFATERVKKSILPSMSELSKGNPGAYKKAIESLKSDDTKSLLRSLGVPEKTAESLIGDLEKAIPTAKDTPKEMREKIKTLKQQVGKLEGGKAGDDPKTPAGKLVLGIGLAASAVSLYNDAKAVGQNPNPKNLADLLSDGITAKQQLGQVAAALGLTSSESSDAADGLGQAIDKLPDANAVLGSVFGVVSTVQDAMKGDDADAVFQGLGAASGLLTTDAASTVLDFTGEALGVTIGDATLGSLAGPIGIGIGLAVAFGQTIYSHIKEETQYENPATTQFLEDAGLSKQAAQTLTREGGGYSAMPIIAKYAELNGYNLKDKGEQQQFAHWLNNMNPSQLQDLLGLALNMQLDTRGDLSKFTKGDAQEYRGYNPEASQTTAYLLQQRLSALGIELPKPQPG